MAEQAQHPYSEYKLYKVWHKQEGRWMANLVKHSKHDRKTLSYARYLMSVHLGRLLEKDEHVDHINNDKTDDRIQNLQILTPEENLKKFNSLRQKQYIKRTCSICNTEFDLEKKYDKFRPNATCSKECGNKARSLKLKGRQGLLKKELKKVSGEIRDANGKRSSTYYVQKKDTFEGERNKYKDPELLEFIICLRDCGYSWNHIGILTNIPKSTIRNILSRIKGR